MGYGPLLPQPQKLVQGDLPFSLGSCGHGWCRSPGGVKLLAPRRGSRCGHGRTPSHTPPGGSARASPGPRASWQMPLMQRTPVWALGKSPQVPASCSTCSGDGRTLTHAGPAMLFTPGVLAGICPQTRETADSLCCHGKFELSTGN